MSSVVVFADTNLFLQCRALHELPWRAVFADVDEILLLVGAPVQDEMDRHKSEGNTRRGRRARDANSLLREVGEREPEPFVVREKDPKVSIAVAPILSVTRTTPSSLDVRRSDEALIEEALVFVPDPGVEVCVLTADGGMRRRARRHGLTVIDIPQAWASEPELTDAERRLRRVEAELEALKRSEPVLTVLILDTKGAEVETLTGTIDRFKDVKAEELSTVENALRNHFPRAELRPVGQGDSEASEMSAQRMICVSLSTNTKKRTKRGFGRHASTLNHCRIECMRYLSSFRSVCNWKIRARCRPMSYSLSYRCTVASS